MLRTALVCAILVEIRINGASKGITLGEAGLDVAQAADGIKRSRKLIARNIEHLNGVELLDPVNFTTEQVVLQTSTRRKSSID